MTRDEKKAEFKRKFRGKNLMFGAEAWAVRKLPPSELGHAFDLMLIQLNVLLDEQFDFLVPFEPPVKAPVPLKG